MILLKLSFVGKGQFPHVIKALNLLKHYPMLLKLALIETIAPVYHIKELF